MQKYALIQQLQTYKKKPVTDNKIIKQIKISYVGHAPILVQMFVRSNSLYELNIFSHIKLRNNDSNYVINIVHMCTNSVNFHLFYSFKTKLLFETKYLVKATQTLRQ